MKIDRRSFLKWLGIGIATAAVAPQLLTSKPEVYPEANYPITLEMLQTAYAQTVSIPAGRYMMVHLAPTSLPVTAGDIVYYKDDKKNGMLAYVAKKHRWNVPHGFGIGNITPGNYGFIQIGTIITVGDWYVHAPARTLYKVEGFKA